LRFLFQPEIRNTSLGVDAVRRLIKMEEARNPLNRGLIETLESTQRRFGSIYPVIMTEEGEVIDGRHRLQAGWDEIKRLPIKDRKDIIALRLVLNASRRTMSPEEKYQLVNELASLLLSRNVKMDQLYLSNEEAQLIDDLTKKKGFREFNETVNWLIKEGLRLVKGDKEQVKEGSEC
jgi:hypothetical protein